MNLHCINDLKKTFGKFADFNSLEFIYKINRPSSQNDLVLASVSLATHRNGSGRCRLCLKYSQCWGVKWEEFWKIWLVGVSCWEARRVVEYRTTIIFQITTFMSSFTIVDWYIFTNLVARVEFSWKIVPKTDIKITFFVFWRDLLQNGGGVQSKRDQYSRFCVSINWL